MQRKCEKQNADPQDGKRVIYPPSDDRYDVFRNQDLTFWKTYMDRTRWFSNQSIYFLQNAIEKNIQRTALIMIDQALFNEDNIELKPLQTIFKEKKWKDDKQWELHPFEPFCNDVAINWNKLKVLTGILLDDQTILAAAHAFVIEGKWMSEAEIINKTRISFDFYQVSKGEDKDTLADRLKSRLYKVCSVEHHTGVNSNHDWVRLKLKCQVEHVKGQKDLDIRAHNSYPKCERLYSIGHPMGLPKKLLLSGYNIENETKYHFRTDLDAYKGCSGAPIFSEIHSLIGILVNGGHDFKIVKGTNFKISNVINWDTAGVGIGEVCQKTSSIK